MNEKFEFVVRMHGAESPVTIEAKCKSDAMVRLESRFSGIALGDYYLARRTVDGQKRWISM